MRGITIQKAYFGSAMALSLLLFSITNASAADVVYPGCDVPSSAAPAHVFYIDPVNGSNTGDGSQLKPWHTLAEVAAAGLLSDKLYQPGKPTAPAVANPKGKVKSGDLIYLMSGDHGNVVIKGVNADFITVMPAPGEKPVLQTINVTGASHWKFEDLKIQSPKTQSQDAALVSVSRGWSGNTDNIIFNHNDISSADDARQWSLDDWHTNARTIGISTRGDADSSCDAFTNNFIHNIRFGVGLWGSNSVFYNNRIDYFGDDALRYTTSNLIISHNTITNTLNMQDGNHQDAMQGFIMGPVSADLNGVGRNIVIDSNLVIRQTDPNLKYPSPLQGIDDFGGIWYNMTITNNIIITSAYHGLSFYGISDSIVANNTVIGDGGSYGGPWLGIFPNRNGTTPSTNVIVRNNLVGTLSISVQGLTVDHNMAFGMYAMVDAAGPHWYKKAGVYGDHNIVEAQYGPTGYFVNYDYQHMIFDLNLKPNTPAIGAGIVDGAPKYDFSGYPRTNRVDLGALQYRSTADGGSQQKPPVDQPPPVTTGGNQVPPAGSTTPGTGTTPGTSPGTVTPPVNTLKTYTVIVKANARQQGVPQILLSVDGKLLGEAAVTADAHYGQVGTYAISFQSATPPKTLSIALNGYKPTVQQYVMLGMFNVVYGEVGKSGTDLIRQTHTGTVANNTATVSDKNAILYTNGATVQFTLPN